MLFHSALFLLYNANPSDRSCGKHYKCNYDNNRTRSWRLSQIPCLLNEGGQAEIKHVVTCNYKHIVIKLQLVDRKLNVAYRSKPRLV